MVTFFVTTKMTTPLYNSNLRIDNLTKSFCKFQSHMPEKCVSFITAVLIFQDYLCNQNSITVQFTNIQD